MSSGRRFAKNAASNIINGSVGAVVSIILPHFFVHDFSRQVFSEWILILQLGAFVNVLNFGLQVAIGRYVAVSLGRNSQTEAEAVIGAGLQILTFLAGIGLALVGGVAAAMPHVFHQIEPSMMPAAQSSLLWVGGALTIGLPASGLMGAVIGLQRNEVPAIINVFAKLSLGLLLWWLAGQTHSLLAVARGYFAVNVLSYMLQYAAFRYVCRGWRLSRWAGLSAARQELFFYCLSLSVWSVSMLLVAGVDTTIVGIFDYRSVAAYGLASNVGNFFSGGFSALLTPLIQVFARHHARHEINAILRLLNSSSFLFSLGLLMVGAWSVALAPFAFSIWVGHDLGHQALPFFALLLLSYTIRNSASPYALYLVASGQQKRVMLTPLFEALSNFGFSVSLCWHFGAIGVAIGAVCGSLVGVTSNFLYNMPRTMPSIFRRLAFAKLNLGLPLLIVLPCAAISIASFFHLFQGLTVFGLVLASALAALPTWRVLRQKEMLLWS